MEVTLHGYIHAQDYSRVGRFLIESYRHGIHHENWLQPRWEYAHYHPDFDSSAVERIGLWESGGKIVAVVTYELELGEAFFQVDSHFGHLKADMLDYAERHLGIAIDEGERKLAVWINDFDAQFNRLVRSRGYQINESARSCWSALEIPDPFPTITLSEGFHLQSLADHNDPEKLTELIFRGFNHAGPIPNSAGTRQLQSAPNYRKDLSIVAVARDGTYVSYCGMWQDHVNRIAYVEPVCTHPDFRRLGLASAVVLEGVRRCSAEGTTVAVVASDQPLYLSLGFRKQFAIHQWTKTNLPSQGNQRP